MLYFMESKNNLNKLKDIFSNEKILNKTNLEEKMEGSSNF